MFSSYWNIDGAGSLDEITKGVKIEKKGPKVDLWRLQQKKSEEKEEPGKVDLERVTEKMYSESQMK